MRFLAHDSVFWRRLAWLGAAHGPGWWVRYSPPAFGLAAAALVPRARRAVLANLRRIRGRASPLREALDVAETFTAYAGCLAEVLSSGSKNGRMPELEIRGQPHLHAAKAYARGIIMITAHTAGWEVIGPTLLRDQGLELLMVMEPEKSEAARRLHDEARRASGLRVAHVGSDPLASLDLLAHLRKGGIVAVQIDRMPRGMRGRPVRLLGESARVPEGPVRLSQASGAPLLCTFAAREGFRRYRVELTSPLVVRRGASEAELDAAAQMMADALTAFLRRNPTQWFDFGEAERAAGA